LFTLLYSKNLSKDEKDNQPDDYERFVKNIHIHPLHDKNHVNASYFDVAILEVDTPILVRITKKYVKIILEKSL